MADLPIPFSAPMIRALLREIEAPGTGKTQTRRPHPPEPRFVPDGCRRVDLGGRPRWWDFWAYDRAETQRFKLPYAVGDRLWVREHWRTWTAYDDLSPRDLHRGSGVQYVADDPISPWDSRFRQGMHMPRWASRITLLVTDVRVERLQNCSEADAVAEGCKGYVSRDGEDGLSPQEEYRTLWDQINGPGAWAQNPWVAAYTFRPVLGNIDKIAG